jgi:chemotaxis family two-component system response regulator Rcp1
MISQQRVKILLAEDNSGDVYLVRRALQKHQIDHDLTVVEDGEAAMRYLDATGSSGDANECPDLILLDLNLPRRSGSQILERLKSNPACRSAPVIVLTSSDSPHDRANAIRLGAVRYFCKPTDLAGFMSLGKVVSDVISRR